MGIYIKNMEKPTSCDVCQFMRSCGKWTAKFVEYNGKNGKTWIPTYPIPEICPLIEITEPHGDLIDRNEMQHLLSIGGLNADLAKTVIEAEGE